MGVGGSNPSGGANYGCLAQLVEHHVDTVKVIGSNPVTSTSFRIATANFYRDWFAISLQKKPNWFESSINAILLFFMGPWCNGSTLNDGYPDKDTDSNSFQFPL